MLKRNKSMKRFISCMLTFAMAFSMVQPALAEDIIKSEASVVETSAVAAESDFEFKDGVITAYKGTITDLVIPDKLNGQDVTEIANKVFSNKNLTSVKFPNTLQKIGEGAFIKNKLTAVDFTENIKSIGKGAFLSNNINKVVFNEGLEEIGDNVFTKCPIVELVIPGSVKIIGKGAFSSCEQLKNVEIHEGVQSIGKLAFQKSSLTSVSIPNSVKNIDDGAFESNKISQVNLGNGLERIGVQAFSGNQIKSLNIPETLKTFYWNSFLNNPGEDGNINLYLPQVIKLELGTSKEDVIKKLNENIKTYASFMKYENSKEVDVPTEFSTWEIKEYDENKAGEYKTIGVYKDFSEDLFKTSGAKPNEELVKLKVIGNIKLEEVQDEKSWLAKDFTFEGTTIKGFSEFGQKKFAKNKEVAIPANTTEGQLVDTIGDKAFNLDNFGDTGIKSLTLPNTIKKIGSMAFRNNNIVDLVLPDSVEELGNGTFATNKDLKTLKLSSSLKVIPSGVFTFSKIEKLVIPKGIVEIGPSAFSENHALADLTISSTVGKIDSRAFWGTSITALTIPGNVKEIGSDAFTPGKLSSLTLEEGIEAIENRAFKSNKLSTVIIPKSVIKLDKTAFEKNSGINIKYASLIETLEKADKADKKGKTEENIKALEEAIKSGKAINDKSDATLDEVNTVVKGITSAINALQDVQVEDEKSWLAKDFKFNGTTLLGFSESGKEKFKNNKDLIIPQKNIEGKIITAIGTGAFWCYPNIEDKDKISSLKLPDTIEVIEARAFGGNLLKSVDIPSSVKSIGDGAFVSNKISDMNLKEGVVSIGELSFGMNELTELTIPTTVRKIGHRAFFQNKIYKITILPGIEKIGDQSFENNKIQKVDLPDTIKEIDLGGFLYNSIKSVTLPKGIKVIGPKAFGINDLESVTIPDSVELICPNSFRKNKGFESGEFKIFIDKVIELEGTFTEKEMKERLDKEVKVRAAVFRGLVDEEKHIINLKSWEKIKEENGYLIFRGKFDPVPVDKIKCGSGTSCENTVENMKMTSLIVKVKLNGKLIESVKPEKPEEPQNPSNPENPTDPETQDKEAWEAKHFIFVGTTVTGFSELGQKKFVQNKEVVIPEMTTDGKVIDSIGDKAFDLDSFGKYGIKSLALPNTIKKIGLMAFRNNNIVNLVLPDSLEELGSGVFASNKDLKTLKLPSKLKIISEGAFSFSKIEKLVIPEGVVEVSNSAFSENKLLSEVTFPSTLVKIDDRAFWNSVIVELTIPGNVKEIGSDAFTGSKLSSLTLQEGIETIGNRAFKRNKLSKVTIPKSVTSLYKSVFDRNPSINVTYASLAELLEKAEKIDTQGKPQEKIKVLQEGITKGKQLDKEIFPQLEEINSVVKEIQEAINQLVAKSSKPILIKDMKLTEANNKIEITISVTTQETIKGTVILKPVDKKGRTYKVICKENNFKNGENEIKIELKSSDYPKAIKEIKVYIWDNLENMMPLSDVKISA